MFGMFGMFGPNLYYVGAGDPRICSRLEERVNLKSVSRRDGLDVSHIMWVQVIPKSVSRGSG